ncbi:MAG: SpoIID/LytB domain-containing protein, partial [bacterium]
MRTKGTAICLITLLVSGLISIQTSAFGSSLKIRVLISSGQPQVSVGTLDKIKVFEGRGERLVGLLLKEGPIMCRTTPLGLNVGEYHVQADFALLSSPDEAPIRVGKRWYRGEIIIHKDTRYHLEVINELDLELYLQGIMKQEISPRWPEACLKAQAIVARSYALYEAQRNADSLFDLKSTVESQAYIGLDGEDPLTNEAIVNTRHMILVNNGQPLPA